MQNVVVDHQCGHCLFRVDSHQVGEALRTATWSDDVSEPNYWPQHSALSILHRLSVRTHLNVGDHNGHDSTLRGPLEPLPQVNQLLEEDRLVGALGKEYPAGTAKGRAV